MLTPVFDLERLAKAVHEVARLVPADRLFARFARSLTIPQGWAALVVREGLDPLFVESGRRCDSDSVRDVLFVRTSPVECTVERDDLQSVDGFVCRGTIRVRVRILPEPVELGCFRRTFLNGADSIAVAGLQRHLASQLEQVLADLAAGTPASRLIATLDRTLVEKTVADRLGAICLAGGLCVEGPAFVQFASPEWVEHCRHEADLTRRQRHVEARTQIQQALASAQKQHLDHLVGLLERMRSAGDVDSRASLRDLIATFSEAERGQMYAALWQLVPQAPTTRSVAVVSGQELLLFEPGELSKPARRFRIDHALGPLRSVTCDARSREAGLLMIGAAGGVHLMETDSGRVAASLAYPEAGEAVRGGVNRAAMSDEEVFASHSELGLAAWPPAGGPGRVLLREVTASADTVRAVQVAAGRLWFAGDRTVWCASLGGDEARSYTGSPSTVTALAVTADAIYAGNLDGQVLTWEVGEPDSARVLRSGVSSPVESIDVVEAGEIPRLVVADRTQALSTLVLGDSHVCLYHGGSRIIRRAAAAPDLFVAMNDNRDQLIAWNPRDTSGPVQTVIIPHLTGSTIQDVALIPA